MPLQQAIIYPENRDDKKKRIKDIDARIGQKLKEIRDLKNLSQTDLADILDISFQQFQKYEKGSNRISFASMLMLVHALDCDITNFAVDIDDGVIGLSDNEQDTVSGGKQKSDVGIKESKEILKLFNSIDDPKTRKYLIKFIKSVIENKTTKD